MIMSESTETNDEIASVNVTEPSFITNHGCASFDNGSGVESYQDMHSLLLCPSQWTALLESPISLVRHTTEYSSEGCQIVSKNDETCKDIRIEFEK